MTTCNRENDIKEIKKELKEVKGIMLNDVVPKLATHSVIISFAKWAGVFFCTSTFGIGVTFLNYYLTKK